MSEPYYQDEWVTLYHGDCRDVLPAFGITADLIVTDPPYVETNLGWDRWPDGWPAVVAAAAPAMWCFGSARMFMTRLPEFTDWTYSQEVVWEKHNGSSLAADRFSRVHEFATFWYQGKWTDRHHVVPTTSDGTRRTVRRKAKPAQHQGERGPSHYVSEDGGPRLMRSVIYCRSMHGRALHPTEKPRGILEPLISYACPPGGTVLDPMAGSGSTADAARTLRRRSVLVEADESYCEVAARRLTQDILDFADPERRAERSAP